MTVGMVTMYILCTVLVILGFIIGYTHGRQWSFSAGVHGACIGLMHGLIASVLYSLLM